LWTSEAPTFKGRYVQFENVAFEPKPVQMPHPPIWIGGNSRPAMRRVARHGDGWIPYLVRKKQLPECLDYIRQQPEFLANPRDLDVVAPLATFNIEDYSHRELGKTEVPAVRSRPSKRSVVGGTQAAPAYSPTCGAHQTWRPSEQMDWFARSVMPAVPLTADGSSKDTTGSTRSPRR
jgi:hypothetical protein